MEKADDAGGRKRLGNYTISDKRMDASFEARWQYQRHSRRAEEFLGKKAKQQRRSDEQVPRLLEKGAEEWTPKVELIGRVLALWWLFRIDLLPGTIDAIAREAPNENKCPA
jgi:hypothetical protein